MVTVMMCIVALYFGLKLAWNILLPVGLFRQALQSPPNTSGSSLCVHLEIILLLALILLSTVRSGLAWYYNSGLAWYDHPLRIALWGSVAVVVSLILCFIQGYVLWNLFMWLKKRQDK
jgi:hypothetical protein